MSRSHEAIFVASFLEISQSANKLFFTASSNLATIHAVSRPRESPIQVTGELCQSIKNYHCQKVRLWM